jgi:hypothetical protein
VRVLEREDKEKKWFGEEGESSRESRRGEENLEVRIKIRATIEEQDSVLTSK